MRGRKPIPTELHAIRGTHRATRHGRDRAGEPIANGSLEAPPAWLTERQQEGWRYAIAHAPRGLLKPIDRAVLAIWVEAEDRHRTAAMKQAELDRGAQLPLLLKTKEGAIVVSPYVRVMTTAATVMLKAGSELGFSPAARPRLAAGTQDDAEELSPWTRLKVIHGGKDAG
jgi:P27 family predicted phage terminase small subunit